MRDTPLAAHVHALVRIAERVCCGELEALSDDGVSIAGGAGTLDRIRECIGSYARPPVAPSPSRVAEARAYRERTSDTYCADVFFAEAGGGSPI